MMVLDMNTTTRRAGTGTWVTPTDELVQRRPELAGDVGKVLETDTDDESAVVRWNGQRKPYRVPMDYIAPKEG